MALQCAAASTRRRAVPLGTAERVQKSKAVKTGVATMEASCPFFCDSSIVATANATVDTCTPRSYTDSLFSYS